MLIYTAYLEILGVDCLISRGKAQKTPASFSTRKKVTKGSKGLKALFSSQQP